VRSLLVLVLITLGLATPAPAAPASPRIDWPAFLARHDLVWSRLPTEWQEGAFLGNGLLGAMVYGEGKNLLSFEVSRTDLTDRRTDPHPMRAHPRLPVGRVVIETAGAITGFTGRLDLWNAELIGTLVTDRGQVRLRSFIHAEQPVLIVEMDPSAGERDARFVWRPDLAIRERIVIRKGETILPEDLNPAPYVEERGAMRVSVQRRTAGGAHAVAWQTDNRRLALSIATSHPDDGCRQLARDAVERAWREGPARLRRTHRAFWNAYYPQSFLSIPDTRLESFYWIQMYKLASATRADLPAIDTLGPWYHRTPWPGIWWNLNLQLSYWPVYTANRLSLGESLLGIIDRNHQNLRENVPPALRAPEVMAVSRTSGPEAWSPIQGGPAPRGPHELSNLVWAMHNYWLHWRHVMDAELLRDRLLPVLEASVNYLLAQLEVGADGKLHLPEAISPEYPKTARDTNYDLALLRWGCEALLAAHQRLRIEHPRAPKWRDTLARLTPYPVGPTGYLIGRDQPLAVSHRHFSHLMMVYPLRLVTGAAPAERALIERSLAHWIGFEGALKGYSFVGASAISSMLGKGEDAHRHLGALVTRFVKPNTMYLEAGPVIETPLAAAQAIHEMLLQSWGDTLRVFPAVPPAWKEASFHDLRAEGAFLVSAARREGRTAFVRVTSLAGEPATLRVEIEDAEVTGDGAPHVETRGAGTFSLGLRKGQSVIIARRDLPLAARTSLPVTPDGHANSFGLP
jgi:hypothetical protein